MAIVMLGPSVHHGSPNQWAQPFTMTVAKIFNTPNSDSGTLCAKINNGHSHKMHFHRQVWVVVLEVLWVPPAIEVKLNQG